MAFTSVSAGPNPDEVATVVAADHRFDDWESMFVQHRWTDAFAWFASRQPSPAFGERCHRGVARGS
jgi:hypothetical protein